MTTSTPGGAATRSPKGRFLRDVSLTASACAGLLALFAHRADDLDRGLPQLPRPAAWSTLWRAGHLPGASLVGLALDDVAVRVDRGFHLGSLYAVATGLRVLREVAGDPQVFVHVDGPCARINVDHAPTAGRYPSALWLPGDRVRDAYAVTIPWYCPRGRYVVWTGLFRGDARLRVTGGAHDGDNRVRVATLDHPAR